MLIRPLVIALTCCTVGVVAILPAPAGATAPSSKFCARLSTFSSTLPTALHDLSAPKAAALARLLGRARADAPKAARGSVAQLAKLLKPLGATDQTARAAAITSGTPGYDSALAQLRTWQTKYCPSTVPTPNLPNVPSATDAACLQEQRVLQQAEDSYSLVNGAFASMTDLVTAQYLRSVSSYYADVEVDRPPGGYTLVAEPSGPCTDLPVAG